MTSNVRLVVATMLVLLAVSALPAASSEAGWYLFVPPSSDYDDRAPYLQGFRILDMKPLSQWQQHSAYDSASECEADRGSLLLVANNFYSKSSQDYIQAVGANKDAAILKHMRYTAERGNAGVDALVAGLCVKSDDPRLRGVK